MVLPLSLRLNKIQCSPPVLRAATVEQGRALMPGHDIYALEAEWRGVWVASGQPKLRSTDAAFLGWLRRRTAAE